MDENTQLGQPYPVQGNQQQPNPAQGFNAVEPTAPEKPKVAKVDHLVEIAELARSLRNVSPSGAETVRDKILVHIGAIQDPKAYDERIASEKKVSDEQEAKSKKDREAAKAARKAEKAA